MTFILTVVSTGSSAVAAFCTVAWDVKRMNKTGIEYLDVGWHPVVGCTGADCAISTVCWARAAMHRQKKRCQLCWAFFPHMHKERLDQPLHRTIPSVVGVCFCGDLFDVHVMPQWQEAVVDVTKKAAWHKFVGLTKQPQNAINFRPGENLYLGVTVNRRQDLWRIKSLWETRAPHLWVSFEPLLESMGDVNLSDIEGIVIGAQTRPTVHPRWEWIADLATQARVQGVKVFLKNNIPNSGYDPKMHELPWRKCEVPV